MAIMGFIVVVAGRVFSDSTAMRVRSQNMLQSSEEAGRVAEILKEDISQAGAKMWVDDSFEAHSQVYMEYGGGIEDPGADLSSYALELGTPGDNRMDVFTFRKVEYSNLGVYQAVAQITWLVEDGVLRRKCEIIDAGIDADADCPEDVEMARDVARFQLLPSKPGFEEADLDCGTERACASLMLDNSVMLDEGFPNFRLIPRNEPPMFPSVHPVQTENNKVVLSDFSLAEGNNTSGQFYLATGAAGSSWNNDCRQFAFEPGETYAARFTIPYEETEDFALPNNPSVKQKFSRMAMFQAGKDHFSIGLRNASGNSVGVPDFLFYPPQKPEQNQDANQPVHFEFSVPSPTTACIAITAAIYNRSVCAGQIKFEDFYLYKKLNRAYRFDKDDIDYNPEGRAKRFVKAFELSLDINKKGETNKAVVVIPVPNNGVYAEPSSNGGGRR